MADVEARQADGRTVRLTEERWMHIRTGHPELTPFRDLIVSIMARPALVLLGRHPGEQWLYGRGGPSQWVKVVVHWGPDGTGDVLTAFPRRRTP